MSSPTTTPFQLALDLNSPGKPEKRASSTVDVEAKKTIVVDTHDVFDEDEGGVDPVYQAKARLLNDAFQEIGMGRYQVRAARSGIFRIGDAILTPMRSGTCLSSQVLAGSRECHTCNIDAFVLETEPKVWF